MTIFSNCLTLNSPPTTASSKSSSTGSFDIPNSLYADSNFFNNLLPSFTCLSNLGIALSIVSIGGELLLTLVISFSKLSNSFIV